MLLTEIVDVRSPTIQSYAELRRKLLDRLGPDVFGGADKETIATRANELLNNATFLSAKQKASLVADVLEMLYAS